jgi:hypothetical protein
VYLVIDDLHTAEPGAVLLTRFIARMRHRLRMLVVVTIRETAGVDALAWLHQLEPEVTRVELGDKAETLAVKKVFGELALVQRCPLPHPQHLAVEGL